MSIIGNIINYFSGVSAGFSGTLSEKAMALADLQKRLGAITDETENQRQF